MVDFGLFTSLTEAKFYMTSFIQNYDGLNNNNKNETKSSCLLFYFGT